MPPRVSRCQSSPRGTLTHGYVAVRCWDGEPGPCPVTGSPLPTHTPLYHLCLSRTPVMLVKPSLSWHVGVWKGNNVKNIFFVDIYIFSNVTFGEGESRKDLLPLNTYFFPPLLQLLCLQKQKSQVLCEPSRGVCKACSSPSTPSSCRLLSSPVPVILPQVYYFLPSHSPSIPGP